MSGNQLTFLADNVPAVLRSHELLRGVIKEARASLESAATPDRLFEIALGLVFRLAQGLRRHPPPDSALASWVWSELVDTAFLALESPGASDAVRARACGVFASVPMGAATTPSAPSAVRALLALLTRRPPESPDDLRAPACRALAGLCQAAGDESGGEAVRGGGIGLLAGVLARSRTRNRNLKLQAAAQAALRALARLEGPSRAAALEALRTPPAACRDRAEEAATRASGPSALSERASQAAKRQRAAAVADGGPEEGAPPRQAARLDSSAGGSDGVAGGGAAGSVMREGASGSGLGSSQCPLWID
jgi:hypothetical protein